MPHQKVRWAALRPHRKVLCWRAFDAATTPSAHIESAATLTTAPFSVAPYDAPRAHYWRACSSAGTSGRATPAITTSTFYLTRSRTKQALVAAGREALSAAAAHKHNARHGQYRQGQASILRTISRPIAREGDECRQCRHNSTSLPLSLLESLRAMPLRLKAALRHHSLYFSFITTPATLMPRRTRRAYGIGRRFGQNVSLQFRA